MVAVVTRTFRSGNSIAVRLPAEIAFAPNTAVTVERNGDVVTVRAVADEAERRRRWAKLLVDMEAIGAPPDGIQPREPFDFPARPGLYGSDEGADEGPDVA